MCQILHCFQFIAQCTLTLNNAKSLKTFKKFDIYFRVAKAGMPSTVTHKNTSNFPCIRNNNRRCVCLYLSVRLPVYLLQRPLIMWIR